MKGKKTKILIIDDQINGSLEDFSAPFAHGLLLKLYLEDKYPTKESLCYEYESPNVNN